MAVANDHPVVFICIVNHLFGVQFTNIPEIGKLFKLFQAL